MPTTQLSVKLRQPSASSRIDCSTLWMITGLNTLSSKWPLLAPTVTATLLPITWQQTMVSASDWVGLTLPGMIELPGSFSGSLSSPKPQRGPEPKRRMSLAIFIRLAASTLRAPCSSTIASWAASASNLLGAVTNGRPVIAATSPAIASANPSWR